MSKRLVAAGIAVAALFATAALAQTGLKTYTDSQNRFMFQYPASLPIDVVDRPNQPVNVRVGAAAYECQMFLVNRPDFVGKNLPSSTNERINVHLHEIDGDEFVTIEEIEAAE